MEKEVTLREAIDRMNSLKANDLDDELEVYLESFPEPHFVIKEKAVKMKMKPYKRNCYKTKEFRPNGGICRGRHDYDACKGFWKDKVLMIHKPMTEKECYDNVKKLHKEYPEIIMNPKEWKRRNNEIKKNNK